MKKAFFLDAQIEGTGSVLALVRRTLPAHDRDHAEPTRPGVMHMHPKHTKSHLWKGVMSTLLLPTLLPFSSCTVSGAGSKSEVKAASEATGATYTLKKKFKGLNNVECIVASPNEVEPTVRNVFGSETDELTTALMRPQLPGQGELNYSVGALFSTASGYAPAFGKRGSDGVYLYHGGPVVGEEQAPMFAHFAGFDGGAGTSGTETAADTQWEEAKEKFALVSVETIDPNITGDARWAPTVARWSNYDLRGDTGAFEAEKLDEDIASSVHLSAFSMKCRLDSGEYEDVLDINYPRLWTADPDWTGVNGEESRRVVVGLKPNKDSMVPGSCYVFGNDEVNGEQLSATVTWQSATIDESNNVTITSELSATNYALQGAFDIQYKGRLNALDSNPEGESVLASGSTDEHGPHVFVPFGRKTNNPDDGVSELPEAMVVQFEDIDENVYLVNCPEELVPQD